MTLQKPIRLSIMAACLVLANFVKPTPRPGGVASAQVAEPFGSESSLRIERIEVLNGTVFFGGVVCGSELVNPISYLRAAASSGGAAKRSLVDTSGQGCFLASDYAFDDSNVYWITTQGQLQYVSRGSSGNPAPSTLTTTIAISNGGHELQVTPNAFFWLDLNWPTAPSRLVRAPKIGTGAQTLSINGSPSMLRTDVNGNAYYLLANTLTRAMPQSGGFSVSSIGAAGKVKTYAINATTIFWIQATSVPGQVQLLSAPLADPSSATTLATFTRSDDVSVSSLIFDARQLYWRESLTVPPFATSIYRLPLAGGTPSLLLGTGGSPSNIATDGRHVYFTEYINGNELSSNLMRISVDAAAVDIVPAAPGIEVVQAIQGPSSNVPLVAGKSTLVRVYAQVQNSQAGTTLALAPLAELRGMRDGVPLPGSPLTALKQPTTINTDALDRRNEANSALFQLPDSWNSGTVVLHATLNPAHAMGEANFNNNLVTSTVTFQSVPRPCLFMVPVQTTVGTLSFPDPAFTPFFDRGESLWPVDHFNASFSGGPTHRRPRIPFGIGGSDPYNLNSDFEMGYLLWNLFWTYNFGTGFACFGAGTSTVAPVPSAVRYGMASAGMLIYKHDSLNGEPAWSAPYGGAGGLAHELGHLWERGHVDCGGPLDPAPFPYPPCQLDATDSATSHVGVDAISKSLIPPTAAADFMSYRTSVWVSDPTYRGLFNALRGGAARSAAAARKTPALFDSFILISGLVGPRPLIGYATEVSGNTVQSIADTLEATTQPSSEYRLVVLDAAGAVISNQPLRVSSATSESGTPTQIFAELVPKTPAPARYEVRSNTGATILTRTAGPNPPVVTLTSPAAGAVITAGMDVRWTASDPDGDALMSTVRYSPDNGAHWFAMGAQTSERQLRIDNSAALPGGAQALIQVIVSDGVHSASATSAPFSVAQHGPQVSILDAAYHQLAAEQPGGGQQSDSIELRAYAYDAEDGLLEGAALQWRLSGPETRTASGRTVQFDQLTPGSYQITLTATDTSGSSAQAIATLNIAPKRIFEAGAPELDGSCSDGAYAQDVDPIRVRYGAGVSSALDRNAQVRVVRSGDWLYACFAGLTWGASPAGFVGLQFNPDNAPSSAIGADDRAFIVYKNGAYATASTPNAAGDGFVTDSAPQGLTAAVNRSGDLWSAEMRIDISRLNVSAGVMRMLAGHYWRDRPGDDAYWPRTSGYNFPNTWGLVTFGALSQSIRFDPIPDQPIGGAGVLLNATATSGLPVMYTASGACQVVGNALKITALGSCSVIASQPGNAAYAPAGLVTRTLRVTTRLLLPLVRR